MNNFEKMIETLEMTMHGCDARGHTDEAKAVEKAIEILQVLDRWCDAYPTTIFPAMSKRDWKRHHKTLKASYCRSGSAAAADCMRHVTDGFKKVLHDV